MADKIDDNNVDFGSIVSFELKEQLKEGIDFMDLVIPVGEIVSILTGIPGVPDPDPNVWQECNGSEIVNPGSPLRSIGGQQYFTPDMTNRYIKVPEIFGQSGQPGGFNSTFFFRHRHAGVTGVHNTPEDVDHSSVAREAAFSHAHPINYSFDGAPVNIEPPYYTVKWFMRIQ